MATDGLPTISRVGEDCTLIELLYSPTTRSTSFAYRDAHGAVRKVPSLDLASGERIVPYAANNNLIQTGCVLFPSDIGEFGDKRDLVADVRAFLRRYVDLSPTFEDIAVHYILLTWVYDAFNEIGYLRFRGDFGTGKTRALLTVGSLCYKPFFASGASTVSPIFHVLDAVAGTLVLDEADLRFSDATADLTKILNNGTVRGLPVLRTMTNRNRELNPQAFRVFGPKLIAMREGFEDQALESRFLTEETGRRPLPPHIPIHLPDTLGTEALALRNKLLAWRFHARSGLALDPSRILSGVSPRMNQTAIALLSLVDDDVTRARIGAHLLGDETKARDKRASSQDAVLVRVIRAAFADGPRTQVPIAEIAERFSKTLEKFEAPITNKRLGWMIRSRLRVQTTKSNGIYVIPQAERARLDALATDFGIDGQDTPSVS